MVEKYTDGAVSMDSNRNGNVQSSPVYAVQRIIPITNKNDNYIVSLIMRKNLFKLFLKPERFQLL